MLNPGAAPFAFGSNLKENPVPNALRSKLPFLDGVETLAVVGNFAPPGVNLAARSFIPTKRRRKPAPLRSPKPALCSTLTRHF